MEPDVRAHLVFREKWGKKTNRCHRIQRLLKLLPENIERWRLIDLPPVPNRVYPSHRMVVIGDAAHATLPYPAQGAAMAIEDASGLGFVLSKVRDVSELPKAPDLFYEIRHKRAHTIQRGSWTNRFFIHLRNRPQYDMRDEMFQAGDYSESLNLMANTLFQEYLYSYDVVKRFETQLGQKQPLSAKL